MQLFSWGFSCRYVSESSLYFDPVVPHFSNFFHTFASYEEVYFLEQKIYTKHCVIHLSIICPVKPTQSFDWNRGHTISMFFTSCLDPQKTFIPSYPQSNGDPQNDGVDQRSTPRLPPTPTLTFSFSQIMKIKNQPLKKFHLLNYFIHHNGQYCHATFFFRMF